MITVTWGYGRATNAFSRREHSDERRKTQFSYESDDKNSSRPRYIRVAAIDIVSIQGIRKIYVVVSQKTGPTHVAKNVPRSAILIFRTNSRSINISHYQTRENKNYRSGQDKQIPVH